MDRNLTPDQIERLTKRFSQIDADKDGQITLEDLKNVHPDMPENPLLERTFAVMKDTAQTLTLPSLIESISRLASSSEVDKVPFVFDIYDVDKDGFISPEDLFEVVKLMCKDNLTTTQLSDLVRRTFREFDTDCDGRISFPEFLSHLKIRLESQLNVEW